MPYTGLFILRSVTGLIDSNTGKLSEAVCISATCLTCERYFEAAAAPDLEAIVGGAILYCSGCGTRQAISNAHFDEYLARTADSGAT